MSDTKLFESLLKQATVGEKVEDPRTGKFESAVLIEAKAVLAENKRVDVAWGDLTDTEGSPFLHTDRIFIPEEDSQAFAKIRFMQKLKALGVAPDNYKEMLYFDSDEAVMALAETITSLSGSQFPITISMDARGFYNTTVRRRKKEG